MSSTAWRSETEQLTLRSLLERRLENDPDGEYLDVCATKLSARLVYDTANSLANALAELGVNPGDRVATLIENSPEATLSWWGTVQAGAISVPINTAWVPIGFLLAFPIPSQGGGRRGPWGGRVGAAPWCSRHS